MLILFQNESDASTSSSPTVKGYESIIKVSYFKSIYLIFCLREEGDGAGLGEVIMKINNKIKLHFSLNCM